MIKSPFCKEKSRCIKEMCIDIGRVLLQKHAYLYQFTHLYFYTKLPTLWHPVCALEFRKKKHENTDAFMLSCFLFSYKNSQEPSSNIILKKPTYLHMSKMRKKSWIMINLQKRGFSNWIDNKFAFFLIGDI